MSQFILLSVFVLSSSIHNEAARILAVFPSPSISHQVVFRPLTQELSRRGHEVVVITTDPVFSKGKANLTEIDVHNVSYTTWKTHFMATATTSGKNDDLFEQLQVITNLLPIIFEQQLMTKEVQNLIKDRNLKFDLLFIEACVRPAMVFSHIFKAPIISISSLGSLPGLFADVGAPSHPMLYPSIMRQKLYDLTMWEKMRELITHFRLEYLLYKHDKASSDMIKKVLSADIPSWDELSNNIDMTFLNVHSIWEENRPVPPSVVFLGGLHQIINKELPKDMQSYLDSSKNGVIYISFGTNVMPSMLPPERIRMLVNVFSQLHYDVLWKWDKDELPGRTANIKIAKWLPQPDLLRHPKVKLFITQGGLQSTDEAITAAVPLIGIPMLVDQWYNVEHYVYHNIGLRLDMETLSEEIFKNAINTVIKDPSYQRNVARLRSLMQDQPQRPLERAVWWTEHVLRLGGAPHLRAPAANTSWSEYFEIELISLLLIGIIATISLISLIMYFICKSILKYFISFKLK